MKIFSVVLISFLSGLLYSQNIKISDDFNPNEPSIIMDPLNPAHIVAGSNLRNVYVSHDTGRTWITSVLTSDYGVWGDPSIMVDTAGDFYFFHLSNPVEGHWIDRIVCQKSTNDGLSWNDISYTGLNSDKEQDKEWSIVDRKNNMLYLTWTQFDNYGSISPLDSSTILFSRSPDNGLSWTTPKRINAVAGDCIDSDNTVEGAVPAVGPNGEVYVAWAGPDGLVFNKSIDQGNTWLSHELSVDPMPGGWDYSVPGIYRANGLPVTACDLSNASTRGTIYINWSDQRNGPHDTDVWLSKSVDGGETWSEPVRVNDDAAGRHQFFTWMTIDQTNGFLYFVFYDRREHQDLLTDVYVAISRDGGNTFINRKISESPFLPDSDIFFGDYTNITAHNGIVRPVWTRLHEGALSIWTHLTNEDDIISSIPDLTFDTLTILSYPNPSNEEVFVSFSLRAASVMSINLLDANGTQIKTIVANESRPYGKYIEKINVPALGLIPGTYHIQLIANGTMRTLKQIIVE